LYTHAGNRELVSVLITENPRIELSVDELFRELGEEIETE
jgi:hypothetical protein